MIKRANCGDLPIKYVVGLLKNKSINKGKNIKNYTINIRGVLQ
jgi:hypothetical protein